MERLIEGVMKFAQWRELLQIAYELIAKGFPNFWKQAVILLRIGTRRHRLFPCLDDLDELLAGHAGGFAGAA